MLTLFHLTAFEPVPEDLARCLPKRGKPTRRQARSPNSHGLMIFRLLGQIVRRAGSFSWCRGLRCCWSAGLQPRRGERLPSTRNSLFSRKTSRAGAPRPFSRRAFPEEQSGSNIVLVLERSGDKPEELKRDLKFVEAVLEPGLRRIAEDEGGLASEVTPSEESPFGDEGDHATTAATKAKVRFDHCPDPHAQCPRFGRTPDQSRRPGSPGRPGADHRIPRRPELDDHRQGRGAGRYAR